MNGLTYIYIYIMYRGCMVVCFVYVVYFGTSHKSFPFFSLYHKAPARNGERLERMTHESRILSAEPDAPPRKRERALVSPVTPVVLVRRWVGRHAVVATSLGLDAPVRYSHAHGRTR